jgi:hypothetical protein
MQNRKCSTTLRRYSDFLAVYFPEQLQSNLEGSLNIVCSDRPIKYGEKFDLTHLVRLANSSPRFYVTTNVEGGKYSKPTQYRLNGNMASCISSLCGSSIMFTTDSRYQKRVRFILNDVESVCISARKFYGTDDDGIRLSHPKSLLSFTLRSGVLAPDVEQEREFKAWCGRLGWKWLQHCAGFQFSEGPISMPGCLESAFLL